MSHYYPSDLIDVFVEDLLNPYLGCASQKQCCRSGSTASSPAFCVRSDDGLCADGCEGQPLPVDAYFTDTDYVVEARLAGVAAEDIDVVVDPEDVLVIKATLGDLPELDEDADHITELYRGSLCRCLALPNEDLVDPASPAADFTNGLLTLRFELKPKRLPTRIVVGDTKALPESDSTPSLPGDDAGASEDTPAAEEPTDD